jgi:hypothetical protein
MGGYPRYCVQCGNGLASNTRFCGNCGHAAADTEADVSGQHAVASRELDWPGPVAETRPGGLPPVPPRPSEPPTFTAPPAFAVPPAPRSPAGWEEPDYPSPGSGSPGFAAPPSSSAPPSSAAPPSFAPPPTGPAYPPPLLPSPAEPPRAAQLPTESAPPLSGPAYPPAAPAYPSAAPAFSPADRPGSPPPDRSGPQPLDRLGPPASDRSGPLPQNRAAGPSYPPAPAQYALSSGSPPAPSSPPPSGATANLSTSWANEVGLKPRWDQAPSALPLITESRTAGDQPRQRRSLVIGLFLLIAAVLAVPALLIVHAVHGLGGTSAAAAKPTSTTSAPSTTAVPNERAAASAVASLLGQSVTDRDTIVNAVGAVNQCTSGLSQAPKAFTDGATGRQKLLQQLAHLPGRSTLPAAMLRELTGAWQASATVDTDLGKWAQDEVSHGCHQNDHHDANFVASNTPDVQASNDKAAFVALWNPIAAKYGLTRYSTSQL